MMMTFSTVAMSSLGSEFTSLCIVARRRTTGGARPCPSQHVGDPSAMIAHPMELRGKTIVVTGAGGFVGRAVCARLLADEARVAAVDRDRAALAEVAALGAEPRR